MSQSLEAGLKAIAIDAAHRIEFAHCKEYLNVAVRRALMIGMSDDEILDIINEAKAQYVQEA